MARSQPFKRIERRLMPDRVLTTTADASQRMARVRQRDTAAELRVRRVAAAMGLRYRTSNGDLPGSPDLANRAKKWALFVHGCFWHQHPGCSAATSPKSNRSFWQAKFAANRARDNRARAELIERGFRVVTLWECQTRRPSSIRYAVASLLSDPGAGRARVL
jgi:DNA mismatch endonuclease (patch repair protein)